MAGEESQSTTPAPFNADALAGHIRQEVRGALTEFAQQAQQSQAQQQAVRQQQAYAAQAQRDPIVSQVVEPYVAPALRAVAVQSQAAMDAVLFYNRHPEASRYQQEIEGDFNRMMQAGTPFDRETVYRHWIGANVDRYQKDRHDDVQRTAARGATLGAPGIGRADYLPTLDGETARQMPFEQLEKALEGVKF